MNERPSFESMFLDVAEAIARRSSCSRGSVGCVVVRDNRIVATGYNGALPGARHCDHSVDAGGAIGDMEHGHCSNALHAEMNAVGFAARFGTALEGGTAYVTHAPCRHCYQALRAAGVVEIVYRKEYRLHPTVAASVHVRKEIP